NMIRPPHSTHDRRSPLEYINKAFLLGFYFPEQPFPLFPSLLAFGNITGNFRRSHYLSPGIPDRRYGQRNIQWTPVFDYRYCFHMINGFAPLHYVQYPVFLIYPVFWYEHRYRLTDRFLRRIAEHTLGS